MYIYTILIIKHKITNITKTNATNFYIIIKNKVGVSLFWHATITDECPCTFIAKTFFDQLFVFMCYQFISSITYISTFLYK